MYKTMKEIENQYDGYWVFMTNCKKGEYNEIIGGEVIAFNKNKKLVAEYWDKEFASETYFRYIGDIPEGMGVLL